MMPLAETRWSFFKSVLDILFKTETPDDVYNFEATNMKVATTKNTLKVALDG